MPSIKKDVTKEARKHIWITSPGSMDESLLALKPMSSPMLKVQMRRVPSSSAANDDRDGSSRKSNTL